MQTSSQEINKQIGFKKNYFISFKYTAHLLDIHIAYRKVPPRCSFSPLALTEAGSWASTLPGTLGDKDRALSCLMMTFQREDFQVFVKHSPGL